MTDREIVENIYDTGRCPEVSKCELMCHECVINDYCSGDPGKGAKLWLKVNTPILTYPKYQQWDSMTIAGQIEKTNEEWDETVEAAKNGYMEDAVIELIDCIIAHCGLLEVFCRENGLDVEEMKRKHYEKDHTRGYHK